MSERLSDSEPIECFRCGVCCERHQPQISPEEAKFIAGNLGLSVQEFLDKYVQVTIIGYLLRRSEGGCIFLDYERNNIANCRIYPFRPRSCREWEASLARQECREGRTRVGSFQERQTP